MQIARQGWGEQKSQNGGANPTLSGPATANYHLWAVAPAAQMHASANTTEADKAGTDLFHNSRVNIDTSIEGLAHLATSAPQWLSTPLHEIDASIRQLESKCPCNAGLPVAQELAPIYRQTLALRAKVAESNLDAEPSDGLLLELDAKISQFQSALKDLLGLDLIAFRTNETRAQTAGFRGGSADETSDSVVPGEEFRVHVHAAQATGSTRLDKVWLESRSGDEWKNEQTGSVLD